MFDDRKEAGILLAEAMAEWKEKKDAAIIALPRGGVPVAFEVAKALHLPLDIICPRKIGAPFNKEFAVGAITESGKAILSTNIIERLDISREYIEQEMQKEKKEAQKRSLLYRRGNKKIDLSGKTAILIDDGLATGSTMKAAITSLRDEKIAEIIVSIPVAPKAALSEISLLADRVICLDTPSNFQAVGQFYRDFSPTSDEEVIAIMGLVHKVGH